MEKHNKDFFINYFEANLENSKCELMIWVESFRQSGDLSDLRKVVNYANSICFDSDLLDVLKE